MSESDFDTELAPLADDEYYDHPHDGACEPPTPWCGLVFETWPVNGEIEWRRLDRGLTIWRNDQLRDGAILFLFGWIASVTRRKPVMYGEIRFKEIKRRWRWTFERVQANRFGIFAP